MLVWSCARLAIDVLVVPSSGPCWRESGKDDGECGVVSGAKYVELDRAPHGRYLCHVPGPLSMGLAGIVMRDTAAARLLTWSLR